MKPPTAAARAIEKRRSNEPSVLEPNFDLFRLYVGEYGALLDELRAAYGAWLRTFIIHTLQRLHLLVGVANVFATLP